MRQGADGEGEEEGEESVTPSKKKKTEAAVEGPVRTLSMVRAGLARRRFRLKKFAVVYLFVTVAVVNLWLLMSFFATTIALGGG